MIRRSARAAISNLLDKLAGRPSDSGLEPGFSVILPTPQDMPFLLRLSLDNLCGLDLGPCRALLVVGDGRTAPISRLQCVVDELGDNRATLLPLKWLQQIVADRVPRADGGANFRHWITIVRAIAEARTEHLFLHDIDAFWAHPSRIREQYHACDSTGAATLGVTARWDPFLKRFAGQVPATWELMFDTAWARSKRPSDLKGGSRHIAEGSYTFDTMLWPQFKDLGSGKIKLMQGVGTEDFVHFNGTITTFRVFQRLRRREPRQRVIDEMFRILLLSLFESVGRNESEPRLTPTVDQLVEGISNVKSPVQYQGKQGESNYGEFRQMVSSLEFVNCFRGQRWTDIEGMLQPFDEHFQYDPNRTYPPAVLSGEQRVGSLVLV